MTISREEIIRMAREVETVMTGHDFPHSDEFIEWCERLAALVAAAEREACAQIADEWATHEQKQHGNGGPGAAIRARGDK